MQLIPVNENISAPKSCLTLLLEEEGLKVFQSVEQAEGFHIQGEVETGIVQFYYALSGSFNYRFGPYYQTELKEGKYFFLYNPEKNLAFEVLGKEPVKWIAFFISLKKLHSLFLDYLSELPFLSGDNANKKLYEEMEINVPIQVALHQLFSMKMGKNAERIFVKSKIYEVLSLHFSKMDSDVEACPFLNDELNVSKIKKAKELLIKNVNNPPTIAVLSREVGINEYRLKSGFKEVYGNTVYGFLLDYKLNQARHLLDSLQLQVNEVAYQIGYTNPSHFISAFKKKFGITPKKYLQSK